MASFWTTFAHVVPPTRDEVARGTNDIKPQAHTIARPPHTLGNAKFQGGSREEESIPPRCLLRATFEENIGLAIGKAML